MEVVCRRRNRCLGVVLRLYRGRLGRRAAVVAERPRAGTRALPLSQAALLRRARESAASRRASPGTRSAPHGTGGQRQLDRDRSRPWLRGDGTIAATQTGRSFWRFDAGGANGGGHPRTQFIKGPRLARGIAGTALR